MQSKWKKKKNTKNKRKSKQTHTAVHQTNALFHKRLRFANIFQKYLLNVHKYTSTRIKE